MNDNLDAAKGVFRWTVLALAIAALLVIILVGCGSGSSSNASTASTSAASSSSSSSDTSAACPAGVTPDFQGSCSCPAVDIGSNGVTCNVPNPAESSGNQSSASANSSSYESASSSPVVCPTGYSLVNGTCVAPAVTESLSIAPAVGAPGYILTWSAVNATQCELGPPGALVLVATSGDQVADPSTSQTWTLVCSGTGGNADESVTVPGSSSSESSSSSSATACTAPSVLIGGICQAPPAVTVALTIDPTTVVDNSLGCPSPAGQPCLAVITATPSSSLGTDGFLCYVPPAVYSQGQTPAEPFTVGPYPPQQDGPQVITVDCTDSYNQTAMASVTLDIIPPSGPQQPDTFTVAGADPYTFTWTTTSTAGQGGCYVEVANDEGVVTTLSTGGTPNGSATTAFLSPSYDPWTATLYCSGSPDPGVPAITVTP